MKRATLYYVAGAVVVVLLVATASYVIFKPRTLSPADGGSSSSPSPKVAATTSTWTGTLICLSPVSATSQQAASCALGLQTTSGTAYALYASDPTLVGSLPTGQRLTVVGNLTTPTTSYKSDGTITVASLTKL
ncbi:hypothetical protein HJC99_06230 [Candidatus Saccharibacteria bacterium]|nr:hypothetical protein [Candidatus Saccharibacteria bacterium]